MLRTLFPTKLLTSCVAAALILLGASSQVSAGGLFWHHGGYTQTTRVTMSGSIVNTAAVPVMAFPVIQTMAPLQTVQMVSTVPVQSFQTVAQPSQFLQAAPAQQVLTLGTTGTVLTLQGAGGQSNPATGFQNGGVISLSTSPTDPVSQNDAVFLAAISNNPSFFQVIEQFVQNQLQDLVNGRGQGLNSNELEAILLSLVKAALPAQFGTFAPEITKALELVIQRIVHRVVGNRIPPGTPTNPPGSTPANPLNPGGGGGAQAFDVSGRIILTPASGNSAPLTPHTPNTPNTPNTPTNDPATNPTNDAKPAPRPVR